MPTIHPAGNVQGHENRSWWHLGKAGLYAQLFVCLSSGGLDDILVRLYVTSSWEMKAGLDVINQKAGAVKGVDQDDVGDQMPLRNSWLGASEDVVGLLKPGESIGLMCCLKIIERDDSGHVIVDSSHRRMHRASLSATSKEATALTPR